MSNQARQPDGVPVGGQFAPAARPASGLSLPEGPAGAPARTPGLSEQLRAIDDMMNPLASQREDVVARMIAERVRAQYPTAVKLTLHESQSDNRMFYEPRAVLDADGNELSTDEELDLDELDDMGGTAFEDDDTIHNLVMGIDCSFDKHVDIGTGWPSMDLEKAAQLDTAPPRTPRRIAADANADAYEMLGEPLGPGWMARARAAADRIEAGQAAAGLDIADDPELGELVRHMRDATTAKPSMPAEYSRATRRYLAVRDRLAARAIKELRGA